MSFTIVRVPKVAHCSDGRGWHTEAVEAWEGDRSLGILKVSWIPADVMVERYSTVLEYACGIAGRLQDPGPEVLEALLPRYWAFQEFQTQPFVAYVTVDKDSRRRGVATALYREAALWLAERGHTLACSDTQSHEAAALWEHLRAREDMPTIELPDGRHAIQFAQAAPPAPRAP